MTPDPLAIVARLADTVAACPGQTDAADAILAALRLALVAAGDPGDRPIRLRTVDAPPVAPGEPVAVTAGRLAMRLDDVALARRWGTIDDLRRVVDLAADEVRQAMLGSVEP